MLRQIHRPDPHATLISPRGIVRNALVLSRDTQRGRGKKKKGRAARSPRPCLVPLSGARPRAPLHSWPLPPAHVCTPLVPQKAGRAGRALKSQKQG